MKPFKQHTTTAQIIELLIALLVFILFAFLFRSQIIDPLGYFWSGNNYRPTPLRFYYLAFFYCGIATYAIYVLWKISSTRPYIEWFFAESAKFIEQFGKNQTTSTNIYTLQDTVITYQFTSAFPFFHDHFVREEIKKILTAYPDADLTKHEPALQAKILDVQRKPLPSSAPPQPRNVLSEHLLTLPNCLITYRPNTSTHSTEDLRRSVNDILQANPDPKILLKYQHILGITITDIQAPAATTEPNHDVPIGFKEE